MLRNAGTDVLDHSKFRQEFSLKQTAEATAFDGSAPIESTTSINIAPQS